MLFPCILEMLVNRKNVLSSKSFYTPADFSPFMNSAERCALILPAGFGIPASWRGENLNPLLPLSLFLLFFLSFPPLPLCRCVFRFVLVSTTSVHRLAEFCCQYSSRGCVCVCADAWHGCQCFPNEERCACLVGVVGWGKAEVRWLKSRPCL